MKELIGFRLFDSVGGGIHCLPSSGEGTGGQYFHSLGVPHFSASVDDFLLSLLKLAGEGSKLKDFAFDEGIPQLLHGSVDDGLIGLARLKDALPKGVERGVCAIARPCPQFDCKDWVSFTHGEVGVWAGVVEYELYVFGFALVVVGVVNGCRDTESPVGPVFDEWGSWVRVTPGVVDHILVHASYYDGGSR